MSLGEALADYLFMRLVYLALGAFSLGVAACWLLPKVWAWLKPLIHAWTA